MSSEKIIIDIDGGDIKMEVQGVKGKKCTKITEPFEKALGKVTSRHHKKEYNDLEAVNIWGKG